MLLKMLQSQMLIALILLTLTNTCNCLPKGCEKDNSGFCTNSPSGEPKEPTLCANDGIGGHVYTYWPMKGEFQNVQRFFSVINFPQSKPQNPPAVVISVKGYGGDGVLRSSGNSFLAAQRYNFVYIQIASPCVDGAGGFGLQFGNDGVANDTIPTPCGDDDSRDMTYLRKMLDWVEQMGREGYINSEKVFVRGFSQNSMYAVYLTVCFADKVTGVWQGGSGLAKTGFAPIVPGMQAQCKQDENFLATGDINTCCANNFCEDCKYWPLYPKTCAESEPERKVIDCIHAYTNDAIACGTDKYMYDAMVREGNDARMLSFEGSAPNVKPLDPGYLGGHKNPSNDWAWVAGCLGITNACSITCENNFIDCVGSQSDISKFEECYSSTAFTALEGCESGCSLTLQMLEKSETPTVTLSEGRFGSLLDVRTPHGSKLAPAPSCNNKFGAFGTQGVSSGKCRYPEGTEFPDSSVFPDDIFCSNSTPSQNPETVSISVVLWPCFTLWLTILNIILHD